MWRYCTEIFDFLSLSAIIDDRYQPTTHYTPTSTTNQQPTTINQQLTNNPPTHSLTHSLVTIFALVLALTPIFILTHHPHAPPSHTTLAIAIALGYSACMAACLHL